MKSMQSELRQLKASYSKKIKLLEARIAKLQSVLKNDAKAATNKARTIKAAVTTIVNQFRAKTSATRKKAASTNKKRSTIASRKKTVSSKTTSARKAASPRKASSTRQSKATPKRATAKTSTRKTMKRSIRRAA